MSGNAPTTYGRHVLCGTVPVWAYLFDAVGWSAVGVATLFRKECLMALGLMHYGLSTDALLQGTKFKAALEERMQVWDDIVARLTVEGGVGETMIPGSPLAAHLAGSRGVKYLVNRGPCFTHVDPMDGFVLGLDPVKDSIRVLGRRPYSVNNLTILLG